MDSDGIRMVLNTHTRIHMPPGLTASAEIDLRVAYERPQGRQAARDPPADGPEESGPRRRRLRE